jgi:hypothetical protein
MKIKDIKVGNVFGIQKRVELILNDLPEDEVLRATELSELAHIYTGDLAKCKKSFPNNYLEVSAKTFWGTKKAISKLKTILHENR